MRPLLSLRPKGQRSATKLSLSVPRALGCAPASPGKAGSGGPLAPSLCLSVSGTRGLQAAFDTGTARPIQ